MELNILKQIISEVLKVDPNEVKLETTFIGDLGADSLDIMRVVMNIEETFQIIISRDCISDIETVSDAMELIKSVKR